jgi:ABC-2 type transport system permease protein
MAILLRIMKQDLRLLAADRTLWVIVALFAMLIGYGVFNGARWAHKRSHSVSQLQSRSERAFANARAELVAIENGSTPAPANPPAAALPTGKSISVSLPPGPLSALCVGQGDLYPYTTTLDIYAAKHSLFNFYEQDNPLNLLAGSFDPAFTLVYLFPLLIMALSYNLLSQEKEQGTLAMTLSHPVSLRTFLLGKAAMRLLLALTLAIGFLLIGAAVSRIPLGDGLTALRLALWLAALIAYAVFWFALAIFINTFNKSSAANATMLVAAWIALVVIAPSLLFVAANTIHPVPSRLEFIAKMREADNYARSEGQRLLAKYYGDHPELVPAGKLDLVDFTTRFYAMRQENQRRMLPETERFEAQLDRQQRLVDRYRYLSPAIVMQEALNDLAGASGARQQEFVEQLRSFLDRWQRHFVPLVFKRARLRAADYDAIPRFHFQEEPTGGIVRRVIPGFIGLLVPGFALIGLALRRVRRFSLLS